MSRPFPARRPAFRGLVTRGAGMLIGFAVATALIVAMQLPLLHPRSIFRATKNTVVASTSTTPLVWPLVGSAALDIPALGVIQGHDVHVAPIASLTKMMTAYVVLKKFPLAVDESGPCHVVTSEDVTTYDEMIGLDESSIPVLEGERLCELQLLNGLLVHSSGNYAEMLAEMVAGTTSDFIALMNQTASALGLRSTHYADVTGYSPASVSTALDQVKLAVLVMKSPIVRSIVIQPSVTLPVAGTVDSYTPYVGVGNVIGVKSGRTGAAGGCDAMAVTFRDASSARTAYVVVLGQRGGDLLGPAGDAALALANSAVAHRLHHVFAKGFVVGDVGWAGRWVAVGLAQRREVWWWPAQGSLRWSVHVRRFTTSIDRGEAVGRLGFNEKGHPTFTLRALGDLSPPSLAQRLR